MSMTQGLRASTLIIALSTLSAHALAGGTKSPDTLAPPLPSMMVHFEDLNMSTPAGGKALLARIHGAAASVCHTSAEWYPTTWGSYRDCCLATVDRVVSKLSLPQLTAVYVQERQRRSPDSSLQARSHP